MEKVTKETDFNEVFAIVISMVENGYGVCEALLKIGFSKYVFYDKITKEQKTLLDMARTLKTLYGSGYKGGGKRNKG